MTKLGGKAGSLSLLSAALIMLSFLFQADPIVRSADAANEETVTVTKADNGRTVHVKVGGALEIQLEGNPTTGFWWYRDDLEGGCLQFVSETKTPTSGALGAPSTGVWRFGAQQKGETKVTLRYYRSWEGKDKAVGTFTVTVKVQ
jgi:inhibitor of cysteine peptidase